MPKKILICEDYESAARALSRALEYRGYIPVTLAKNNNPAYVINRIGEAVKKYQPDYIILDGLDGLWIKGVEIAKDAKPNISTVILSGDYNQVKKAQEAGFLVFDKNKDELDSLCEFLEKD